MICRRNRFVDRITTVLLYIHRIHTRKTINYNLYYIILYAPLELSEYVPAQIFALTTEIIVIIVIHIVRNGHK